MRLGESSGSSAAPRPAPAGSVRPKAAPPRSLIRGESILHLPVCIDYLNLSIPKGNVLAIIREWCALLGVEKAATRDRGLHGYERSVDLSGFAIIAFGGAAQRGTVLVSVNGTGCRRIASFLAVRVWAEAVHARITRIDIAADDESGKVLGVSSAKAAWRKGAFNGAGRPPIAQLVDDLGSGKGRTLYVGNRLSGKLVRVYEKGKQLGDAASTWVRAELELHSKDKVIPFDILSDPVRFLAGSYRYFARFSLVHEVITIARKAALVTLETATRWARFAVGKTLNAIISNAHGDIGEVFMRLRRDGVPAKLQAYFHPSGEPLCAA